MKLRYIAFVTQTIEAVSYPRKSWWAAGLTYARHQPGGGEPDPGGREQDPGVNLENLGANWVSNLKKTLAGPRWTGICLVLGFASSVREALDWLGSEDNTFTTTSAIISHLPVPGASMTRAMVVEVM